MAQKRVMAGQSIPLYHKLRNGWQLYKEHKGNAWGGAATYVDRIERLEKLVRTYAGKEIGDACFLEIGCGQRAVVPLVLAGKGCDAHGIDVEVPTHRMNPAVFVRVLKMNGLDRAMKSFARHVLVDRAFFAEITRAFDLDRLPFETTDIRTMDAAELDFPDNQFDLIFSAAAFEHISDVEGAVKHINRVLTPNGVAQIHAHVFTSLSGGHSMDWQSPDTNPSTVVPPWDHLRDNKFPVNTSLNKLRIRDFKEIFSKHMVIREESYTREGLQFLDSIPEALLSTYTPEELTTNGLQFIVTKKTN